MDRPQFIKQLVDWLRAGYPDGIPENDYIPLFGILTLKLRDKDIKSIAKAIAEVSEKKGKKQFVPEEEANKIVSETLGVTPTDLDMQRVIKKLRKKGLKLEIEPSDESK